MEFNSALNSHETLHVYSPITDARTVARTYWDRYYDDAQEIRHRTMPSDFCTFSVNTVFRRPPDRIVDLGCGNGRDAIYLAQRGFHVTAIDQSASALMLLTSHARETGVTVETHEGDFTRFQTPVPCHVYSRFSLHAIDDDAQFTLFRNVRQMVTTDYFFAIEARTTIDIDPIAQTHVGSWEGDHFRRYLHVPSLLEQLTAAGFSILTLAQGRDLAPLQGIENPHVVRIIAT